MVAFDIAPLLSSIDPDEDYITWVTVGMALKHEGYPLSVWEEWSKNGSKYHEGECAKKWDSFKETAGTIVTGATITQLAKDRGWEPKSRSIGDGYSLDLTTIPDTPIIDPGYVDDEAFLEPPLEKWNPVDDLLEYLNAVFKDSDHVGISTKSFQDEDGKWKPIEYGDVKRTAAEIKRDLKEYRDISLAVSTVQNKEAGAWIRFNPLDGNGAGNSNVTAYRYALVESDKLPPGRQLSLIRALKLPAAAIVYSGAKSIHAIVHIDADTMKEYRERVETLYTLCRKNGLDVDTQNKNPSRFSRLPGVMRGDKKQFLISTNEGFSTYGEWLEWMQAQADDLPDFEELETLAQNPPPLSPEIIAGVLRAGHKMLISGPSKAGKSFLLIQLAIAMAEGAAWLGHACRRGRVLYINLEIDRASCTRRFLDVYQKLGISMTGHVTIWNLRGEALPMDKLAPKLIRRAESGHYAAIIVDPIYKVITGDENSASDMAKFCNLFDQVAKKTGAAIIIAHHHSKGAQGLKKAIDRASGSGVFGRDPDALIDLVPLTVQEESQAGLNGANAYRVSATLREFQEPPPVNVWFEYPLHRIDKEGFLDMAAEEGTLEAGRIKSAITRSHQAVNRQEMIYRRVKNALAEGEKITVSDLAEEFECSKWTIWSSFKKIKENHGVSFSGAKKTGIITISDT